MVTTARRASVGAWAGLLVGVALVTASVVVPEVWDWEVFSRADPDTPGTINPLHALWEPTWFGPGTLPALLLALLALRHAADLARGLRWPWLLVAAFGAGAAWTLALALVDGADGLERPLAHSYEYLPTAREMDDVPAALDEWVSRIPRDAEDNWATHVAGHPPLATLVFVALVRLGLSDLAIGTTVAVLAATTAPAVLVTLRALGAEGAARRAAPFLVLTPAVVFAGVSADGLFAAVAAWGMAALAVAATATSRAGLVGWSLVAGLVLGSCVLLSYGLPVLGVLALAVLLAARQWRPLPLAVVAALALVLLMAWAGFAWWEAFPVLRERYWDGLASDRPGAYWTWANLACLLLAAGPLLGAGVGALAARATSQDGPADDRVVRLLAGAGVLMVVLVTASQMSRAEVERIWLPFMPWVTLTLVLLPSRWQRPALAAQLATGLLLEHLIYTSW